MKHFVSCLILIISLSCFAETVEYSYDDLKAIDHSIDDQLEELGVEGDASNVTLVVNKNEDTQEIQFGLKHPEPFLPGKRPSQESKHLFAVGAIFSYAYLQGIEVSYLHYRPSKEKVNFHIDASFSGTPRTNNLRLSFDPHIGKWGFFAGVNAQLIGIKSELLPNSPRINIYAGGVEMGWQKEWGKKGKVVTTAKVGVMGTQYEFDNLYMPEASFSIKYMPFRKGHRKASRGCNY